MAEVVLDASAVLAIVNGETGDEDVRVHLDRAVLSAVNYAEVAARLADVGMPAPQIAQVVQLLGIEVVSFTPDQALVSGGLRPATRAAGLSLGDRACLALALERDAPAVTADHAWAGLDVGARITMIR